jgi:glycosyltransferase involved in cell wall biosynthesis
MACGLPAIATTNTGAGDVIREGTDGFVIPIRDVEALKDRISFLYEHQEHCSQMGKSAKERVNAEFTLGRYLERLLRILPQVLAANRRTSPRSS